MEHWQLAYLGMRQTPDELNEFERATFFTPGARHFVVRCGHLANGAGIVARRNPANDEPNRR